MMTFKQLEAIYWVGQLGGFSQAAQKLHTTQSAVSKRVQELEALFDTPLFDRSLRTARLTEKGEEMFLVARDLLAQRDSALERFTRSDVVERRLRVGVTELTALSWLPRLVGEVQARYPRLVFEPDVDDSFSLRDKLLADELDLAILPALFEDARLLRKSVGTVQNAWMCKPGLLPADRRLRVHDVAAQTLLTQGNHSGTGLLYDQWFKAAGATPSHTVISNNLVAIIGMTISGLGVSHLPRDCLQPLVAAGMLAVLEVSPPLPDVHYVAVHKREKHGTVADTVIAIAQQCCDFSQAFQTPRAQAA